MSIISKIKQFIKKRTYSAPIDVVDNRVMEDIVHWDLDKQGNIIRKVSKVNVQLFRPEKWSPEETEEYRKEIETNRKKR